MGQTLSVQVMDQVRAKACSLKKHEEMNLSHIFICSFNFLTSQDTSTHCTAFPYLESNDKTIEITESQVKHQTHHPRKLIQLCKERVLKYRTVRNNRTIPYCHGSPPSPGHATMVFLNNIDISICIRVYVCIVCRGSKCLIFEYSTFILHKNQTKSQIVSPEMFLFICLLQV